MLGRDVVEGQEDVAVLGENAARRLVLGPVLLPEVVECQSARITGPGFEAKVDFGTGALVIGHGACPARPSSTTPRPECSRPTGLTPNSTRSSKTSAVTKDQRA